MKKNPVIDRERKQKAINDHSVGFTLPGDGMQEKKTEKPNAENVDGRRRHIATTIKEGK